METLIILGVFCLMGLLIVLCHKKKLDYKKKIYELDKQVESYQLKYLRLLTNKSREEI